MAMKKTGLLLTTFSIAFVSLFAGCSKLTYKRWQTLTLLSTKDEVQTVLGDDHVLSRKPDRWMYHDADRQISVNLEFAEQDRLSYSRWLDPDHGVQEIGRASIEDSDVIEREMGRRDFQTR